MPDRPPKAPPPRESTKTAGESSGAAGPGAGADAVLREAISAHQKGDLAAAETLYRRVLKAAPENAVARHLLGVIASQRGRFADALALMDEALAAKPDYADAWSNRGNVLVRLGRTEDALESFDRALAIRPDYPEALSNRASTLEALGHAGEAVESCERALELRPDYAEARSNMASALCTLGRYADALASANRALAARANFPEAWSNRGNALMKLSRPEDALASYERALDIRPDYPEALNHRGNALAELGRAEEAVLGYDRAIRLRAEFPEAWSNRGRALMDLARFEDALASFDRAVALRPDYADALTGRGNVLMQLGRADEAIAAYRRAAEARPGFAEARFNEALCRLQAGDYAGGFAAYESRWDKAATADRRKEFDAPLWTGEQDLAGKTVLLYAEQGLGDTIQFARFAPLIIERGSRVVVEVQPPLASLMASLASIETAIARGAALPPFDLHCPLLSLPHALGTTLETLPAKVPYLSAPPARVDAWRERLAGLARPLIGLAWAGNPAHLNDRNRSLDPVFLAPLLECGATLISLQKEVRPDGRDWLDEHRDVRDFGSALADFADTAALMACLDAVVSADTAVAHLAGALARPVSVLLPFAGTDWRWMRGREDSPWYPTARLFRQSAPGAWWPVVNHVRDAVRALADAPPRA